MTFVICLCFGFCVLGFVFCVLCFMIVSFAIEFMNNSILYRRNYLLFSKIKLFISFLLFNSQVTMAIVVLYQPFSRSLMNLCKFFKLQSTNFDIMFKHLDFRDKYDSRYNRDYTNHMLESDNFQSRK